MTTTEGLEEDMGIEQRAEEMQEVARVRTEWVEEGILRQLPGPGDGLDADGAREALAAVRDVAGKFVLLDLRAMRFIHRDARQVFEMEGTFLEAVALLVERGLSRVIANFFIRVRNTNDYDVRAFDDEDAALAWLRDQRSAAASRAE